MLDLVLQRLPEHDAMAKVSRVILTDEERRILDLTADVWNAFCELPVQHPNDTTELGLVIHDLQRFILARPGEREIIADRKAKQDGAE